MNFSSPILNILIMAGWSFFGTTAAVIALAAAERKPLLAPVNAVSHIIYGDSSFQPEHTTPTRIVIGAALNCSAMIGWSAVAELGYRLFGFTPGAFLGAVIIGSVVTILAYFVDFYVVPKRFTPGFENILTKRSLLVVYLILAVSLILGGIQRIN